MSRSIHLALHIHKDPAAMAERVAHHITQICEDAISERGVFTIALSGGSTPLPLFRLLSANDWIDRIPWEKIRIYWVDERCVHPDDPKSNYGIAREALLSHVPVTRYYRMKGEVDPVKAALDYEELIKEHFQLQENEFPRFDCVLLGLGADGHTASLYPGEYGISEKKRIVVDQFIKSLKADRLSLTLPVLNNARNCIFMVSGKEKHHALTRTLNLLEVPELPAQMVRPPRGELIWVVDESATHGIN